MTGLLEVGPVPGGDDQPVRERRSGDQAVLDGMAWPDAREDPCCWHRHRLPGASAGVRAGSPGQGECKPCRRHDPVTVGPWAGADPPVKRLGSDSCVRLTDAAARTWPLVGADGASAPFGQEWSRPPRPRQLAVRRAPRTSNGSVRVIAPASGRAGTGVRSAMIENCTAAAVGLPALSLRCRGRDVHRHGSRGRGRDPSPCSSRCSPAAPTRYRSRRPRSSSSRRPSTTWCPRPRSSTARHRRRATSRASLPFPRVDRQPVLELDGDDALGDLARVYPVHAAGSVSVVRIGRPAHASCAGSSRSTPSG